MTFNPDKLVRENIKRLKPYTSARDEFSGAAMVFLDANENAYGAPFTENVLNRYPDPYQKKLKEKIASWLGVKSEQIFLGNGSDEAIDLLLRVFGQPAKDAVLVMPPTYGMYMVSAQINDLKVVEAPLTPEFEMDRAAVERTLSGQVKLVFVCSPNNPTGNVFPQEDIVWVLENSGKIVIVDEAYIDFAPDKSVLPLINRYPNLVVLRTFSKAWGSATIRLGMAFADPKIINWLNKIKMPYNVNGLTQKVALDLLENVDQKNEQLVKILAQRRWLKENLEKLKIVQKVFSSDANFLLVRFKRAREAYRFLMEGGIIVRDRTNQLHCENCLRITVGTEEENRKLIERLEEFELKCASV
ncbi:histidinol-phosphate transaminase [Calditrichota bacterium GD2]